MLASAFPQLPEAPASRPAASRAGIRGWARSRHTGPIPPPARSLLSASLSGTRIPRVSPSTKARFHRRGLLLVLANHDGRDTVAARVSPILPVRCRAFPPLAGPFPGVQPPLGHGSLAGLAAQCRVMPADAGARGQGAAGHLPGHANHSANCLAGNLPANSVRFRAVPGRAAYLANHAITRDSCHRQGSRIALYPDAFGQQDLH